MFQQNLEKYPITIVVINTNKLEDLVMFLASFKTQMNSFEKHKAYIIDK